MKKKREREEEQALDIGAELRAVIAQRREVQGKRDKRPVRENQWSNFAPAPSDLIPGYHERAFVEEKDVRNLLMAAAFLLTLRRDRSIMDEAVAEVERRMALYPKFIDEDQIALPRVYQELRRWGTSLGYDYDIASAINAIDDELGTNYGKLWRFNPAYHRVGALPINETTTRGLPGMSPLTPAQLAEFKRERERVLEVYSDDSEVARFHRNAARGHAYYSQEHHLSNPRDLPWPTSQRDQ